MSLLKRVSDYEALVNDLQEKIEELNEYKEKYLECDSKLLNAVSKLNEQQQAIDTLNSTLNRLIKENKHLWALVAIKGQES